MSRSFANLQDLAMHMEEDEMDVDNQ